MLPLMWTNAYEKMLEIFINTIVHPLGASGSADLAIWFSFWKYYIETTVWYSFHRN